MSQEFIEILGTVNQEELTIQLALQCAPLLTGIKISNLLIVNRAYQNAVKKLFKNTNISHYVVHKSPDKVTFLLFQKENLLDYLAKAEVINTMKFLGYSDFEFSSIMREFSKRFLVYMRDKKEFPHEMGLLLGYPVEDVVGFIENQGKNFLYTGYWKVYHNLSERIALFQQYNEAKELMIRMVSQGVSIQSLLSNAM